VPKILVVVPTAVLSP